MVILMNNENYGNRVYTGDESWVDLDRINPVDINIYDMCMAVSRIPRFSGASGELEPINVAGHSVLVRDICVARYGYAYGSLVCLHALIHDLHEAVTGDVTVPIAKIIGLEGASNLKRLQFAIDMAIQEVIGIEYSPNPCEVKAADKIAAYIEGSEIHGYGAAYKRHLAHDCRMSEQEISWADGYIAGRAGDFSEYTDVSGSHLYSQIQKTISSLKERKI